MFAGLVLIIVGAVFLLQNLGVLGEDAWNVIWPAIIVLLGILILVKPLRTNTRIIKENKKPKKD